ncbi:MAG: NAD-dependent epimerase/dehydratase family protein, partial [Candidatus Omnitrophica bacterium]|nr:NAD-dependent epimerase/dehydratase family protein [Candidatus Omnitrophota bacterium]
MNILVTGANGFLASHLIPALLKKEGVSICGTYRKETGRLIQDPTTGLTYEYCDLSKISDVTGLFKKYRFDAIIHTAGAISTRNDYAYLEQSIRDNMAGQANLVSEAIKGGCKIYIFCSSMAIYGDSTKRSSGFREDDAAEPREVYGWSKSAAEELLRVQTEQQQGMRGVTLRLAGIHGLGRQGGAVYNMIHSAVSGEEVVINEPESRFRFLFV